MTDDNEKKDGNIIARLPKRVAAAFKAKAAKNGKKVSEQIRELIDKFLK